MRSSTVSIGRRTTTEELFPLAQHVHVELREDCVPAQKRIERDGDDDTSN